MKSVASNPGRNGAEGSLNAAHTEVAGIPAMGQLVTVRQRRYVVTGIAPGSGAHHALADSGGAPHHLVTLQSVDDDGLGEELRVVWELEPGATIFERATLPDPTRGFDDPSRLDAFSTPFAGAPWPLRTSKTLHAPFRSGITLEDYQLDPVARALSMPRVGLLIADNVGLGKTIEAGLVVQELLLRHRARTVLVVCPAGLQLQWRDQMRDKFGLEFRIVDSEGLRELRRRRGLHVNPWTHFPRLITSMDFLKRERPSRLFREVLPPDGHAAFPRRFDLLIVDEAHNVAPSGRGHYAVDSLRTQCLRSIAPHFEHKLFLSATPHNGYTESFSALLELLDDRRFHRGVPPDRTRLASVMVRRLKHELPPDETGRARFPKRTLRAIEVAFGNDELEAHAWLTKYTRLRTEGAEEVVPEKVATDFVLKLLKKRLFSSPAAFQLTLAKHARTLAEARQRAKGDAKPRVAGLLRRELEGLEEDFDDDQAYEASMDTAVTSTSAMFRPLSEEEGRLLSALESWARAASEGLDAKARQLVEWLRETVRPTNAWNDTRVIVFTEYKATLNWLVQVLAAHGLSGKGPRGGERVLSLFGAMVPEERERIKAAFQAAPEVSDVRILLATDAASEGIDLQNHCSRLIHYEIPWNPNRLEQRNGRVDRHGQRDESVQIFHFVGQGWDLAQNARAPGDYAGDLEFLARAAWKVDQIREDLGNAGDVLAQQVEQAMLGKRRALEVTHTGERSARARQLLKIEHTLRTQLEALRARLAGSREDLGLTPSHLQHVVEVGLRLAGHPPLEAVKVPGKNTGTSATAWRVPPLGGTWAVCSEGLEHPHTREVRPVVFDHDLAKGRDDLVLAHLNHRLVQLCLGLLRAELWAPEGQRKLHRVSAKSVPRESLEAPVLIAHARLVVLGGDGLATKGERLHEEVLAAGGSLRDGKFVRFTSQKELEHALAAAAQSTQALSPSQRESLAAQWPQHEKPILSTLETRAAERVKSLARKLAERADKEAHDVRAVLEELRKTILDELDRTPDSQLTLNFTGEERAQFERNKDALTARAASIPQELAREEAAIRARYATPTPRLFPVALTYLVPEGTKGVR